MKPLLIHPTDVGQWYALVNEAQSETRLILNEDTESYLVFLLMRFTHSVDWLDSTVAVDFLESMQMSGHSQIERLRQVGDKSLLFCGLFPGYAKKRQLSSSYYEDMGQSAYYTVSSLQTPKTGALFLQLSEQFLNLKMILSAVRGT